VAKPCVLVTGGAGYVGSHVALALLDDGYPTIVLDNLATGFRIAVDDRAAFVEGGVEDGPLVAAIIAEHGVRAILHFAGSISAPESVENPLKYYHNNTRATCALLETAVALGVPHFVFSSSAAVYGAPDILMVDESVDPRPISPYGRSKLMGELMLADVAAAHSMNYCALRYFNVAGADPDGRSGQRTTASTNLLKVALEVATGRRSHVPVYGLDYATPDGAGVRDYIHVSDLACAHLHALEALLADERKSLVLNCGYGRGHSVLEVLAAVERACGARIPRLSAHRRAGDPAVMVADNRAMLAMGWRPRRADLDGMVTDALKWEVQMANALDAGKHQAFAVGR